MGNSLVRSFSSKPRHNSQGFSLIEVIVALGVLSLGAVIVSSLFIQLAKFNKNSRVSSTVLDLKIKNANIARNLEDWAKKLNSDSSEFKKCFNSNCSDLTKIKNSDLPSDLQTKVYSDAGSKVVSARIVDLMGDEIAGTLDSPLYLTDSGTKCTLGASKCPLVSVGYVSVDGSGNKIKVFTHLSTTSASEVKVKAHVSEFDLDKSTITITENPPCPTGSVLVGLLADGTNYCVPVLNVTSCKPGEISLGLSDTGSLVCKKLPDSCKSNQIFVYQDNREFGCADPVKGCPSGTALLGKDSNGKDICIKKDISCPNKQIMSGLDSNGNPICESLPLGCEVTGNLKDKNLVFKNGKLICEDKVAESCPNGKVARGIAADGSPVCIDPIENGQCKADEEFRGFDAKNGKICAKRTARSCPDGEYIASITADNKVTCNPVSNLLAPPLDPARPWMKEKIFCLTGSKTLTMLNFAGESITGLENIITYVSPWGSGPFFVMYKSNGGYFNHGGSADHDGLSCIKKSLQSVASDPRNINR